MKKSAYFTSWGILFVLCAVFGFLPAPQGVWRGVLTLLSVLFFVPPFLLLHQADQKGDKYTIALIRNLSALSLFVTMVLLILNFLSVAASETLGDILYYVLVIVSSPMICSGYWALSLFLWACLMIVGRNLLKKKNGSP